MITFCKKWGHYGLICPVVFLSKELREKLWNSLLYGMEILCSNRWFAFVLAMGVGTILLYYRSAEIYTYSMSEELQYLGRLPIVWERQKKLYIPTGTIRKSCTGRFVIKSKFRAGRRSKKKTLVIYAHKMRFMLEWDELMHFQIRNEGTMAIR